MSVLPATPVVTFHTSCLQDDISLVPPGPGAYAAILLDDFHIHGPADTGSVRLPAGTPLVGQAHVDSFGDAVCRHLYGALPDSDLRLGVALLRGHEPIQGIDHPLADLIHADIDYWLGACTAFVFWPGVSGGTEIKDDGFFGGVARSWAARTGHPCASALH